MANAGALRASTLTSTWRGLLSPFEVVSFRWAWAGLVCSLVTDQAETALLAVVALNVAGSASVWASILTAQAVPRIALIVVGGVAADRLRPWLVLGIGNALEGLALVVMALLLQVGALSIWHLYAFVVAYGCLAAFTSPSADSLMPTLLPRELVRNGNALRSLALNIGRFAAAPLATTALVLFGAPVAFVGVAALCGVAAVSFVKVRVAGRAPALSGSLLEQARGGLNIALSEPLVGVPILMLGIFNLGFSAAAYVGLPALAKLELEVGAQGLGVLLGSLGAGALMGAIAMLVVGVRRIGLFGCTAMIAIGVGLLGSATLESLLWISAALVVGGIGISCAAVALLTVIQVHAPVEQRGRVTALWSLAFTGVTPLSYAAAGILGQQVGPRGIILLGAACVITAGVVGLLSRPMRTVAT